MKRPVLVSLLITIFGMALGACGVRGRPNPPKQPAYIYHPSEVHHDKVPAPVSEPKAP